MKTQQTPVSPADELLSRDAAMWNAALANLNNAAMAAVIVQLLDSEPQLRARRPGAYLCAHACLQQALQEAADPRPQAVKAGGIAKVAYYLGFATARSLRGARRVFDFISPDVDQQTQRQMAAVRGQAVHLVGGSAMGYASTHQHQAAWDARWLDAEAGTVPTHAAQAANDTEHSTPVH